MGGDANALRSAIRSHTWPAAGGTLALERYVRALDRATRRDGFHLLESWDYTRHCFAGEPSLALLLDQCTAASTDARRVAAIIVDHYFLMLLSLLAARAWDDGDPNANLDRVNRLVSLAGGARGSGFRLVDDAATLLLLAISQYHPRERAYHVQLERIGRLDDRHRLAVAIPLAGVMGTHLRWGFQFMYRRDIGAMRKDNVVDYPWLRFAVATLVEEYARADAGRRPRLIEPLMNSLSADPWAFMHIEHREALLAEFAAHAPRAGAYSPLGFSCNFLCNVGVAAVAVAACSAETQPPLNALFAQDASGNVEALARTLMAFSRTRTGGAGSATLIVYEARDAHGAYNQLMRVLAS